MSENGKTRKNLTTRQGHPVYDNQNQRTVGERGPSTMENYHFLSHRRLSHDSSGGVIADSDRLHSMVDIQFARTFKHLLDRECAKNH